MKSKKGKKIANKIIKIVGKPKRSTGKKLAKKINKRSKQIIG